MQAPTEGTALGEELRLFGIPTKQVGFASAELHGYRSRVFRKSYRFATFAR